MLLIEGVGFQLRMHPVHDVFGIAMIAAGLLHASLDWQALLAHLRGRRSRILAGALAGILAILHAAGVGRPLDPDTVRLLDEAGKAAERGTAHPSAR